MDAPAHQRTAAGGRSQHGLRQCIHVFHMQQRRERLFSVAAGDRQGVVHHRDHVEECKKSTSPAAGPGTAPQQYANGRQIRFDPGKADLQILPPAAGRNDVIPDIKRHVRLQQQADLLHRAAAGTVRGHVPAFVEHIKR